MESNPAERYAMRNRAAAFIVALLFLPPLAISLSGQGWDAPEPVAGAVWLPALFGAFAIFVYGLLLDTLTFRRTGHSLLRTQRSFLFWNGAAGSIACLLLAYLNLFAGTWITAAAQTTSALLLAAICGTVLLPAVLVTRLWLAGLVRLSTRRLALPAMSEGTAAAILLPLALTGLIGGAIWPVPLGWLFWAAPLLLLVALQLLWHESTVFSGLAQGDWSRILWGTVSGVMVGSIGLAVFRLGGGAIYLAADAWQLIFGLALFGLLCLQVGDVVAEHWRGKQRTDVIKKKPFPIPVVSKKEQ